MASTGSSSSSAGAPSGDGSPPCDVVIGIASFNDAKTVGGVARGAATGMIRRLGGGTGCIVVADGGSTDRCVDRAREALAGACELVEVEYRRPDIDPLKAPYHGRPGRPAAVRAVLRAADERQAKVCVMLDARLVDFTPEWVERLVAPVLGDEADYVSAHYVRHPHEGAITKSLIYPVFRALYGHRLRQPASLEFGCSSALMKHFIAQGFWDADDAPTAIDLWLATSAATGGYRIAEAQLGVRRAVAPPGAPDLATALGQIVGAMMTDLETRAQTWQRLRGPFLVPVFGEEPEVTPEPPPINIDSLLQSYRLGYSALRDVWAWVLPPKMILELKRLADAPAERFRVSDEQWARIVYDFALAHRLQTMRPDHLLGALTPLYLGWLASFVLEPESSDMAQAEQRIERLCAVFEAQKAYLISRWRWPERFRS